MKKILSFMAIATIMMGLSACSSGGPASSPKSAVENYLNALKKADVKALVAAYCRIDGTPVDFSEVDPDEIKQLEAIFEKYSDLDYTIGAADINNNFAKVEVTVKFKGEEQTTTVVCIKCPDGKWLVYDSDLVR